MKTLIRTCCFVSLCLCCFSAVAQRYTYKISWRGTAYTTNPNGSVTSRSYSEREIINRISANNGLNPTSQTLAYVHDEGEPAEELEIVPIHDGARTTANVYQFLQGDALSTTSGSTTLTKRMRFIFDEAHGQALGTIFGSERLTRRADGSIISFSYRGKFQFTIPDDNTVITGTFSTGKLISRPTD